MSGYDDAVTTDHRRRGLASPLSTGTANTPSLRGNEALNFRAAERVPIVDRPARGIALLPLAAATATMERLSSAIGCSDGNPVACDDSWMRESCKATACLVDVVGCYTAFKFEFRGEGDKATATGKG